MNQRIYHTPEGFMSWCQKCGTCLESKSQRGILVRLTRHKKRCIK